MVSPFRGNPSEVVLAVLAALGSSPFIDKVKSLFVNGEWDSLATLEVSPHDHASAQAYFRDAQAAALFSKNADLPTSFDKASKAKLNWWDGEKSCYRTNIRLSGLQEGEHPHVDRLLQLAREKIRLWIGSGPPLRVEGRFGPGATYADPSVRATVPDKMNSVPTATPSAFLSVLDLLETGWGRALTARGSQVEYVRGNRHSLAPKNAKTDRNIAIEPSVNIFYQLALGNVLRQRLKWSTGIDLRHAAFHHRRVACSASILRDVATIDLRNASDTLSYALVRRLMPSRWFRRLCELRSSYTFIDGQWVKLEKFSSMGNGYTFELETLVFLALCCAACEMQGLPCQPKVDVSVFGDDILVPTAAAKGVVAALAFCGLETNVQKTFIDGPFRESCGADFYDGVAVRPFFMKEVPNAPEQWIKLANGLRRAFRAHFGEYGLPTKAWFKCLDALPSHIRRCRGPEDLGDIVVHDERERWDTRTRGSIRYIRVYRPARYRKVPLGLFDPDVILAYATYGGSSNATRSPTKPGLDHRALSSRHEHVVPRDGVIGYKVGWVPYS